jgi:RNA polymerase sigma-70 factor (ECF subfamily)
VASDILHKNVAIGVGGSQFPSTAWSQIAAAQESDPVLARHTLALLLERYWKPVCSSVRRMGLSDEDAQDLTQDFFIRFIQKDLVSRVDRARGRFRSFLRAAVSQLVWARWRRAARRPKERPAGDDAARVADAAGPEAAPGEQADRAFAADFARQLVGVCTARLRAECEAMGKHVQWRAFEARYLAGGEDVATYAQVGQKLGLTAKQAGKQIELARRRFVRIVRSEVSHTLSSGEGVDQEIRDLLDAVR